jgi:hypothetical protein
MASRLRILQKTQQQAREQGRDEIMQPIEEVFEPGDRAALDAYEQELLLHSGAQPLPFEVCATVGTLMRDCMALEHDATKAMESMPPECQPALRSACMHLLEARRDLSQVTVTHETSGASKGHH